MMQDNPQQWFLGEVEFDATRDHFTRVHPVAVISEDGSRWEELASDLQTRFPKRGLVCWFDAPPGTRKQMMVEFQAVPNLRFDETKRPEKLEIRTATRAVEVIELDGYSERQLREALTGEGIALGKAIVCRCIFKVSAERWIGPFDLVERKPGHWALGMGVDLEAIPVHTTLPAPTSALRIDGKQRLVAAAGWTLASSRLANWLSDEDVLRGVLKRLHKLDLDRFKNLHLTYAAFDSYVSAVAEAKLLPDQQLAREQARAERVKELRAELPLLPMLVEEIVATLENFDAVRKRLDDHVNAMAREKKADIDARVVAERAELQKLEAAVADARAESTQLAKQIAVDKKALSAELMEAEEVMRERLNTIRKAPVRAVTELLATSALLPSLMQSDRRPNRDPLALKLSSTAEPPSVEEPMKVITKISQGFLRDGVALDSMFALVAAFVGGLLPVCAGDAAAAALRCIGRSLCGREMWCLPVSPIATSLQDILEGTGSIGQRKVIGGLLDVIETTLRNPDSLSLCVLEGIDLAPTDGFLIPLTEIATDGSRERPAAHRIPLLASDGSGLLEWPRNLLLAVTVVGERTSLPLPRRIWDVAPLFDIGWSETPASALPLSAGEITRVLANRWLDLRSAAERDSTSGSAIAAAAAKPPARMLALRLYRAAMALGAEAGDAHQKIETHVLTPALASAGRSLSTGRSDADRRHFELAATLISDSHTNI